MFANQFIKFLSIPLREAWIEAEEAFIPDCTVLEHVPEEVDCTAEYFF